MVLLLWVLKRGSLPGHKGLDEMNRCETCKHKLPLPGMIAYDNRGPHIMVR